MIGMTLILLLHIRCSRKWWLGWCLSKLKTVSERLPSRRRHLSPSLRISLVRVTSDLACVCPIFYSLWCPLSSWIQFWIFQMPRRRWSQRSHAGGTLRHLRWSCRLPNSYQANHLGRILLEDYAARLLPFCEEVCALCQIHAPSIHFASNIFANRHLSMAIFYVGLWCCGPHHSFCFKRLQIFSCTQ